MAKKSKDTVTGTILEFTVQPFAPAKVEGEERLAPATPERARDEAHAIRLGERLAARFPGVVVLRRQCDPTLGDYGDPAVLAKLGDVPSNFEELLGL